MAGADRTTSPRSVKLTYDDFLQFPDDGMRHELIDGEHFVTPSPNPRHQRILESLYLEIGNHLKAHPFVARLLPVCLRVIEQPDVAGHLGALEDNQVAAG